MAWGRDSSTDTYLGVNGDVLSRDDKGNNDCRDREDGNLDPQERTLRCIHGFQREGPQRPDITVRVYAKDEEQDKDEMASGQLAQTEAAYY